MTKVCHVLADYRFTTAGKSMGKPFRVAGKESPNALLATPFEVLKSVMECGLPAGDTIIHRWVAICTPAIKDVNHPSSPVTFRITVYGAMLSTSQPLTKLEETVAFMVDVRKASRLELRTSCQGNNGNYWSVWV